MPLISIESNVLQSDADYSELLDELSAHVAQALGKPESYVMVRLVPNERMLFAGSPEPLAFVELKSIGLPESATAGLSKGLSELIETRLGVPADRTYIEFADAPRRYWGWNGSTF
ncbi:MAG: phenylpyruvate tautomerase MIF-related protein [Gammaproteobacteria bacterium]|jgi:phenylpyruvate tautomerase